MGIIYLFNHRRYLVSRRGRGVTGFTDLALSNNPLAISVAVILSRFDGGIVNGYSPNLASTLFDTKHWAFANCAAFTPCFVNLNNPCQGRWFTPKAFADFVAEPSMLFFGLCQDRGAFSYLKRL